MAKKEFTIEELRAQWEALGAELEAREKAEAEAKKERLEAEKQRRYEEVVDAYKKFEELKDSYVDDYGYFFFGMTGDEDISRRWIFNPAVWF